MKTGETDSKGVLSLEKLEVGEYRLFETKAPNGFNRLTSSINIVVTSTGITYTEGSISKTAEQDENGTWIITVVNEPGAVLPSTGGPGTALYTSFGITLILLALLMLLRARTRE